MSCSGKVLKSLYDVFVGTKEEEEEEEEESLCFPKPVMGNRGCRENTNRLLQNVKWNSQDRDEQDRQHINA